MSIRATAACTVVAILSLAGATSAGTPGDVADDDRTPFVVVIPTECEAYAPAHADAAEVTFWYRRLSLAACMQPTTRAHITAQSDVEAIVSDLTLELAAPMLLYQDAIGRGPTWVKLRAVYHVGLSTVGLVIRLRASVIDFSDRQLRARLERRLRQHVRIARLAFATVGAMALEDPSLAADEVGRGIINTAARLLDELGGWPSAPWVPDRPRLAGALQPGSP